GGKTAGMQLTRIRLSTFKGAPPSLRRRRSRVLGLYFSTASLVMGLRWPLVARSHQRDILDEARVVANGPAYHTNTGVPAGKTPVTFTRAVPSPCVPS